MTGHLQGSAHTMTSSQYWIASRMLQSIHAACHYASPPACSLSLTEASWDSIVLRCAQPCDIIIYWLLLCNPFREENVVRLVGRSGWRQSDFILSTSHLSLPGRPSVNYLGVALQQVKLWAVEHISFGSYVMIICSFSFAGDFIPFNVISNLIRFVSVQSAGHYKDMTVDSVGNEYFI